MKQLQPLGDLVGTMYSMPPPADVRTSNSALHSKEQRSSTLSQLLCEILLTRPVSDEDEVGEEVPPATSGDEEVKKGGGRGGGGRGGGGRGGGGRGGGGRGGGGRGGGGRDVGRTLQATMVQHLSCEKGFIQPPHERWSVVSSLLLQLEPNPHEVSQ